MQPWLPPAAADLALSWCYWVPHVFSLFLWAAHVSVPVGSTVIMLTDVASFINDYGYAVWQSHLQRRLLVLFKLVRYHQQTRTPSLRIRDHHAGPDAKGARLVVRC
jgi:hypothetical protein